MNTDTDRLISREAQSPEGSTQDLSSVAEQLIEAAGKARKGDHEATTAHIAHAMALLRRILGPESIAPHSPSGASAPGVRGGLPAWAARKVIAHVEANLSRRIPIGELARLLGLSASHFCRVFKCTLGASPRDYVLRRRIQMAQELMLTTPEPLSSIAARCGMCDQQHFTRSFHRLVGETPHSWRRSRRASPKTRLYA
jgi:AraC family transcriptional regulator